MGLAAKLFLTYACLSMLAGGLLMFLDIGRFIDASIRLVTVLWMGPILIGVTVAILSGLILIWGTA